jgi:hypothetical protein
MAYKMCKRCNEEKDVSHFGKHSAREYGLDSYCKICKKLFRIKWLEENKEQYKKSKIISDAKWYSNNKDKKMATNNKWKSKNKEYHTKYSRLYKSKREKKDPMFKVINKLRTRIWYAIKRNNKSKKTLDLLGCSIEQLKTHLESQFTEGMSWENYGKWHIDHIIPLSSFNLQDEIQLSKSCHYSNLQPLWAKDNLSKGNKIT